MANNWDDEFASFDLDLIKAPTPAADDSAAGDAPVVADAEPIVPAAPIPSEDSTEEEEDDMGMDASIKEAEEKLRQSEERRKEHKKPNPYKTDEPKPQDPMDAAKELMETANQLAQQAEAAQAMMEQIGQVVESSGTHVKGVKSALRRMDDYVQVMLAAKAVVETLVTTERPEAFETLDASRFSSIFKKVKRSNERKTPKMKAAIGDMQSALGQGDKEEAAAVARLLKQHAMSMQDDARDLAAALCETTSNYPDPDGQLALFSLIADQGDADSMAHIDHAMRLTGQVVVPVGEAKAMLEARANGDQQTIDNILDRLITSLVEEEKQ